MNHAELSAATAGRPTLASPPRRRRALLLAVVAGALAPHGASAVPVAPRIRPPVSLSGQIQLYSLTIPNQESSSVTTVILAAPPGFDISSFVPDPGWRRELNIRLVRGNVVQQVVWSGGHTAPGTAALFQFLAEPTRAGTYTFTVTQSAANGETTTWSGSSTSSRAAPTIEARTTIGGSSPFLTTVAFTVAAVSVVLAFTSLLTRGRGPLA